MARRAAIAVLSAMAACAEPSPRPVVIETPAPRPIEPAPPIIDESAADDARDDAAFDAATPETLTIAEWRGDIVADETHVYFPKGDALWRIPSGGGTPSVALARPGVRPFGIDATHVYATLDFKAVIALPKAGGDPADLAALGQGVWLLAVDADSVFMGPWLNPDADVTRTPRGGGAAAVLARGQDAMREGLLLDDRHVYWSAGKHVRRCLKGATTPEQAEDLGEGPGYTADTVAIDATHVYWSSDGSIMARPKDKSRAAVELARARGHVRGLTVSARHVYWLTDEAISRVSKRPGSTPLVKPKASRFSPVLAANQRELFWLSSVADEMSENPTTPYHLVRLHW